MHAQCINKCWKTHPRDPSVDVRYRCRYRNNDDRPINHGQRDSTSKGAAGVGSPDSTHPDISHAHFEPCQQNDATPGSSLGALASRKALATCRWDTSRDALRGGCVMFGFAQGLRSPQGRFAHLHCAALLKLRQVVGAGHLFMLLPSVALW